MARKQGSMARYGPRYGVRQKKIGAAIERLQNQEQPCPYCERPALKRLAAGIWFCRKCSNKFAGGAYFPTSAIGSQLSKIEEERGKSSLPAVGKK